MPLARRRTEELRARFVLGCEAGDEIGTDFIVVLTDHRPERRTDAAARGAEPLHGGDGRFDHARQRAAPAGMRGADDARVRIGEQHRPAIGGADPDRKPGHAGHDGVGARSGLGGPRRLGDDDVRRVNLIGGEQAVRLDRERRRHAGAIFGDQASLIARAHAAIEARIDAPGDAALAGEEGVAEPGQLQRFGLDHHRAISPSLFVAA